MDTNFKVSNLFKKTPTNWRTVRNIAVLVGGIAGYIVTLPISGTATVVIGAIAGISGVVATFAQGQSN